MRHSDARLLGMICFAVGGISFLFGVIAYVWEETLCGLIPACANVSMRDYAFPLGFIGVVLIVVGLVVMKYEGKEEKEPQVST